MIHGGSFGGGSGEWERGGSGGGGTYVPAIRSGKYWWNQRRVSVHRPSGWYCGGERGMVAHITVTVSIVMPCHLNWVVRNIATIDWETLYTCCGMVSNETFLTRKSKHKLFLTIYGTTNLVSWPYPTLSWGKVSGDYWVLPQLCWVNSFKSEQNSATYVTQVLLIAKETALCHRDDLFEHQNCWISTRKVSRSFSSRKGRIYQAGDTSMSFLCWLVTQNPIHWEVEFRLHKHFNLLAWSYLLSVQIPGQINDSRNIVGEPEQT